MTEDAEKKKFSEIFNERFAELESTAKQNGVSLSAICRTAKVARYTPELWKAKLPRTIEIFDALEAALQKEISKKKKAK